MVWCSVVGGQTLDEEVPFRETVVDGSLHKHYRIDQSNFLDWVNYT